MDPFCPFRLWLHFELPCTIVESYARLYVKTSVSLFSYYTETTRTTYEVPVPGIYSKQHFAAGTPIVLLYEKGDAVRIEPRPPSPNTCRFCARSSMTLFRHQASGDGTRMKGVLGESRASCRLSIDSMSGSNSGSQQQQYEGFVDNSWQWLTHPLHRLPPCRTESSWLRAGRVWACTRQLQSVHEAAELVCRERVVVLGSTSWVLLVWDGLYLICVIGLHINRIRYQEIT